MIIKKISNDFFETKSGILVDNAYDPYTLRKLTSFYEKNNIEYLEYQDYDLSSLKYFESVSFLSIPQESVNFENLSYHPELKGLRVFSSNLNNIDSKILKNLEYLNLIFDENAVIDFNMFESLRFLRIMNLPHKSIQISRSLEKIEFCSCKKIQSLDFLEKVIGLKKVKLSWVPKLTDISCLKSMSSSLTHLFISDCKRVINLSQILNELINLTDLTIIVENNDSNCKIPSLNFIDNMKFLEYFATNYRIEDGDLLHLCKIRDANITAFYSNYNLKDKDLPHEFVLLNDVTIRKVKLSELESGKDDSRIIWLDWDNRDLDLYYLNARYYDGRTGRFISPDSIEYLDSESVKWLNLYAYCENDPVNRFDPNGHSWESFWNRVGNYFSEHWKEVAIGTAFVVCGALVTALTAGAGVGFMSAFGSALLSSTIQIGISECTSVLVGGLVSVANGGGFFDNVGDNIANAYMWGGIFSGGAQILGGGFRIAANKGVTTGRAGGIKIGNSGAKILSPDKNSWAKAGGTLIKFGKAFRIDTGAMWGVHAHILSSGHLPIGAVIAGFIGTEY